MQYIHVMGYYSAMKRKGKEKREEKNRGKKGRNTNIQETQMKLKNIILGKRSQTQDNKYYMVYFYVKFKNR